MNTKSTVTLIESLFSQSKEYAGNRIELLKLKAIDKTSGVVSAVITGVALLIIGLIFFIILNIGIALLIGDLLGKSYWGFLILALVYAIAGFVVLRGRDKFFKTPVSQSLIRKFL